MDRETELKVALSELHRRYQDEAKPLIDELVALEAMKPPTAIYLQMFGRALRPTTEQMKAFDEVGGNLRLAPADAKPVIMEPSHYVLPRGTNSMVKTASYFNEQKPTWGNDGWKSWKPVYVDIGDDPGFGIEAARELAAHMEPIAGGWKTLEPHLPDELALRPHNTVYQACRGKWRSPIA